MRAGQLTSSSPIQLAQRAAPIAGDQADDELVRSMRAQAHYLVQRYAATPGGETLMIGLRSRGRSLERVAQLEARVRVEEVERAAAFEALLERLERAGDSERGELEDALAEHSRKLGEIRAERSRLDARLVSEARGFQKILSLLQIRLRYSSPHAMSPSSISTARASGAKRRKSSRTALARRA